MELKIIGSAIFLMVAFYQPMGAQDSAKKATITNKLSEKTYVFEASSVSPMRGGHKQLTIGYILKVKPDSVTCDLPYFGRAYQATPGSSEGGIKFISTKFEYSSAPRKKGGWEITIKPKDITDVRQLFLTVFDNGNTTLNVSSNNRDPISYAGYIDTKN